MKKLALAAIAVAAASAGSADAKDYNFSISYWAGVFASGVMTTGDTLNARGGYDILDVTGTLAGQPITFITAPYTPDYAYYAADGTISPSINSNWVFGFDNTLYTNGGSPFDDYGILLKTSVGLTNIYQDSGGLIAAMGPIGGNFGTPWPATIIITPVGQPAPTPEPASWALFIGGFGLTGMMLRRRRIAIRFG